MTPQLFIDCLSFHAAYRQPVIAQSQPGTAKSSLFRYVFRKFGLPEHTINLALSDGTDMRGLPHFVDSPVGRVTKWVKEEHFMSMKPIAVFVDETFQGDRGPLNTVAPLFLENRIDDITLHPGSWVVGATNRLEDRAGTTRPPSHLPNRVTMLDGPDISTDDFTAHLIGGGTKVEAMGEYVEPLPTPTDRDIRVIQYLRMKKTALNDFNPDRLINATPRSWEWVATFFNAMPEKLRHPIIAGRVGEGYATEVIEFARIANQLPPLESILMNPTKAPVPENMSALYMVSGMLAHSATANNFDSVATYADRMPPEFQAMMVKDAMTLHPEVTTTKAFAKWGVKFAQVLS
jgi:hypothetical protein